MGCGRNCMAVTGLIVSVLAFGFLIWGVADLEFKRRGIVVIYIFSFVLVILSMIGFIILLIFPNLSNNQSYRTTNDIGRFISLAILCMCVIAFIFLLIAFIFLIVDYNKLRKFLKDPTDGSYDEDDIFGFYWAVNLDDVLTKNKIAGHEWGAVFVPSIIGLICLILMALTACMLYTLFKEDAIPTPYPIPPNLTQNSTTNINNIPPTGMFPNNNVPNQPVANNIPYPVIISETGNN